MVFAGYLLAAIVLPRAMYVDRYLLRYDSWYRWVPAQILPSMYTAEILITGPDGSLTSVPHHPARMFWIFDQSPRCETYKIGVRYRGEADSRTYRLCDNQLIFDPAQ